MAGLRSPRLLRLLVLCAVVLPTVSAALVRQPNARIEGRLLDALSAAGTADMVIHFAAQADLAPAYAMAWDERGRFVHDALRDTAAHSQRRAIQRLDGLHLRHQTLIASNELYVWAGTLQAATGLAALPEVAFVRAVRTYYIDPILTPGVEASPDARAWGIDHVDADLFWGAFGLQGDGMVVANIDTGVQWDHPALDQAFKCGANPSDPACWADPSNICGGSACDNNGHGTHTMGTMAGDDDPTLTWQAGMAPNATWIACKGCESSSCSEYALNTCADWILAPGGDPANRPHVVNNSWGGSGGDDWYRDKVQAWRAAGVFPAFSAGNAGSSCSSLGSPGDYQESFASAAHDSGGVSAYFSSRGPSAFGSAPYTKPNLSAPGVSVCSAVPTDGWSCGYSGTSMASPHTAGAVALLWSCNPGLIGQIDQTFEILQDNARAAPAGNCGAPPGDEGNYTYGYGYLNVYDAGLRWCGGTGWLEGHLTDATTGGPVAGAVVAAVNQSGPGSFGATTTATGYYTMTALAGSYNMTVTAYGYLTGTASGVVVAEGAVTTRDLALLASPSWVVSGTVAEAGTGSPLYAQVQALGVPVAPAWTDPASGFYSITLAAGAYTLRVTAAGHSPVERAVVVDHNRSENWQLALLPCIVLVDDDQDNPDVRAYYTAALDAVGLHHDVWDVLADGSPAAADLAGYRIAIWFTGYPYADTFTSANEAAVAAYLDAGGSFFLSAEDYLWDMGLTPFGQNYLGVTTYADDKQETDVVGNTASPIGDGLGPYYLAAPAGWTGHLWTDYVYGPAAPFRFQGSRQDNATSKEGNNWKTVFLAWPLEAVPAVNDRAAVMTAVINFLGGCGEMGRVVGRVSDAGAGTPLAGASVTARSITVGAGIEALTDPNGCYTLTLLPNTYDITARKPYYATAIVTGVVVLSGTVVVDLEMEPLEMRTLFLPFAYQSPAVVK